MATGRKTCPRCGELIPRAALAGNCPRCLAAVALSRPSDCGARKSRAPPGSLSPQRFFGDYEILDELARGGMGVVYRARQVALNRLVALKMIAAGQLASPGQVHRFRIEAEAAARLDHPNIVPIYEVGEHEGQHFFSMKLVEGGTLAMAANASQETNGSTLRHAVRFDVRHSVGIMSLVARAVHYAHQRGVLHRDLKPTNILLDAQGQPHVTDFGLAKLLEEDATLTQSVAVLGTPAYMAPELATGKAAHATTAADVYGLGAVLYELLAGHPPFVAENVPALLRKIVEEEPAAPVVVNFEMRISSSSIRTRSDAPVTVRRSGGSRLSDLQIVCLKCLEKDPSRRYASAATFADDLDRWLRDEPIHARPATEAERFGRWCRRQPALAGVSCALVIAVLGGLIATSILLWQEKQATRRAAAAEQLQQALRTQAETDKEAATMEAQKSRQLSRFLQEMLLRVGPEAALGRDTTLLRELLDQTAQRLDRELTNQPAVAAELRDTIGGVYYDLGAFDQAVALHREALRLRRQLRGEEDADVARSKHRLAGALAEHGDLDEAEALNREARATLERLNGPEHPTVADELISLGAIWFQRGDPARAQPFFEQALKIYRQADDPKTETALHNLANTLTAQKDYAQAEKLYREAVAMACRQHGETNTTTAFFLSNLGELMRRQNKLAEADALHSEALVIRASLLDDLHPLLASSFERLAQIKGQERKWDEAETLYRKALAARRKKVPDDPRKWDEDANALANLLNQQQKFAETESFLTDLLATAKDTDPRSTRLSAIRGSSRARHGQWRAAAADLTRAYELDPTEHWHALLLAPLLVETGDTAAYEAFCHKCLTQFAATTNPDIASRMTLACVLAPSRGADLAIADQLIGSVLATPGYPGLVFAIPAKALVECRAGRPAEAAARLEELLAQLASGKLQARGFVQVEAHAVLALAYHALGCHEQAGTALARAFDAAPAVIAMPTNGDYGTWHEWLILQIHLREAKSLIEGATSEKENPAAAKP